MDFATTVKELRRKCLLSQMDFAKEIGVSFSTVNAIISSLILLVMLGRQESNACGFAF